MKNYSFYDATGALARHIWSGLETQLAGNTPDGFTPIEGHFDYLSQRIDLTTGEVVDYQPPQPSDDHEWNAETKRWLHKPEVIERNQRIANARAQLQALDASETRAVSDVLVDPADTAAIDRLKAIRAQKSTLREQLK